MIAERLKFHYIYEMSKEISTSREIVVIGLGYVGLTLSAHMASLGLNVLGIEVRSLVLDGLESREAFFYEPGLNEVLRKTLTDGSFRFSSELEAADSNRVFIITVGTPINSKKQVLEDSIIRVAHQVSMVLNDGDLVILRSTVKLNTTRNLIAPILNKSQKAFFLAFCPERTLEGAALVELKKLPQIVGGIDDESANHASEFFSLIAPKVVKVRNSETAEMIKLIDNVQRDIKFAIANEIADICNSEDIKASEVISFGKLDYPRTDLPYPGPVGGPCLEKDTYILSESLLESQKLARIAVAARQVNEDMIDKVASYISSWLIRNKISIENPKIVILGMAFKGIPETNDLRGTPSLALYGSLKSRVAKNSTIEMWDPIVSQIQAAEYGHVFTDDLNVAIKGANCVVLANNHPSISRLTLSEIGNMSGEKVLVYDMWGRFDESDEFPINVEYISWGSHGFLQGESGI
jgi:UDP-N-acetyl-D-mannosaminuronic acid dehydrogenase